MLVNLITKHGVMPKKCFPESYSCESSMRMNGVLKSKVRPIASLWKSYRVMVRGIITISSKGNDIVYEK